MLNLARDLGLPHTRDNHCPTKIEGKAEDEHKRKANYNLYYHNSPSLFGNAARKLRYCIVLY